MKMALEAESGPVTSEHMSVTILLPDLGSQSPTRLHSIDCLVFTFALVALGNNGRDP